MKRILIRLALVMGVLLLLACMGLAWPVEVVFFTALGWITYLYRVIPQVRIDGSAAATAIACLVLIAAGSHQIFSWIHAQTRQAQESEGCDDRRWPMRWTCWMVAVVLLMFVAGIATVGITHQVGWLLTSDRLIASDSMGAAWRALSTNNLKQIGLALHQYLEKHESFPPAGTFDQHGRPLHGWQAMILPFMEFQAELHNRIEFGVPWNDVRNAAPYRTPVTQYLRPPIDQTKDAAGYALSHYAGNVSMLGGSVSRTLRDVSDGGSDTIMAGEVVSNFKPWGDPTNWRDPALGIDRSPHGFGSPSPGGANFLFVDGSVRFLKDRTDPSVLKALSTPAGGEKVSPAEY
jgi:prepilin-type processing-associated H-X9-DG protein